MIDPSELRKGSIYYLCNWSDMNCTIPKIDTIEFVKEQIAPAGKYVQYLFIDPHDRFQIEAREHLARLGEPIADKLPELGGELTMDVTGLEFVHDLRSMIAWLRELESRIE